MRFTPSMGRRLSPLLLAVALSLAAAAADAQVWSSDFNISEGDVNETQTPLNGQRAIAVDDSNNVYFVFADNRDTSPGETTWEIYFRRFTYNFGSPTMTRATNQANASRNPSIATLNWGAGHDATAADSGRVYMVWQDARPYALPTTGPPKSYSTFFRTYMSRGGEGFGPEFQVSPYDSINPATGPVVACGDSNRVWIVYPRGTGVVAAGPADLWYAVYDSKNRTMGPEQRLTNDPAISLTPTIAATRDGVIHVAWNDSRSGKQQIWTKRFVPGSGWTADEQLVFSPLTSSATLPSLIATYTGHVHLVWRDNRDGNLEIYYKEYDPITGWDPADTRLTTHAATQTEPNVDADVANNVYVVYKDQRNGSADHDIYFQQRTAGVWGGEVMLVGVNSDPTNSYQEGPGIAHDSELTLFVVWTDYRLPSSSGDNKEAYYKSGTGFITGVENAPAPGLSRLLRNYPNPFNPRTRIEFQLPRDAQVSLRAYDVSGRLVRTLVDGYLAGGRRVVDWDGKGDNGVTLASGTYFLRLEGAGQTLSRRVNLLK